MKAPLPENEDLRLKALHSYRILDSPPESQFDNVAALAANICGAPIAMVSLVARPWQRQCSPRRRQRTYVQRQVETPMGYYGA
jgi:hypothetical protein